MNFLKFNLDSNRFFFQNFAMTKTEKVRTGHFWTISSKFRVFLVFKGLNETFFRQLVRKCSPKYLEAINVLSFLKYLELLTKLQFLYNEL